MEEFKEYNTYLRGFMKEFFSKRFPRRELLRYGAALSQGSQPVDEDQLENVLGIIERRDTVLSIYL